MIMIMVIVFIIICKCILRFLSTMIYVIPIFNYVKNKPNVI